MLKWSLEKANLTVSKIKGVNVVEAPIDSFISMLKQK